MSILPDLALFALLRNLRLLSGQRSGDAARVLVTGVGARPLAARLAVLEPTLQLDVAGDGASLGGARLAELAGARLSAVIISQAYHALPLAAPAAFAALRAALDEEHGALGMTWRRALTAAVSLFKSRGARACPPLASYPLPRRSSAAASSRNDDTTEYKV